MKIRPVSFYDIIRGAEVKVGKSLIVAIQAKDRPIWLKSCAASAGTHHRKWNKNCTKPAKTNHCRFPSEHYLSY
jgi:invasion protein IalB